VNRLKFLLDNIDAEGVSRQQVLANTGISAEGLDLHECRPTVEQYRALFRNIMTHSPPGAGIRMGLRSTIADEGVLGYASLSSSNIREVNNLTRKYHRLSNPFMAYSDTVVEDEWILEFTPVFPLGDVLPFVIEDIFARPLVEFKMYTGIDKQLRAAYFSYPEPAYISLYEETFQCPLYFGQSANKIVVDASYLDSPIIYSNPEVCKLCEAQCEKLLKETNQAESICTDVRRQLLLNPGKFPSLEEMSRLLHLSPAAFQKKLRDEKESYRDILNNIRRDLAIQYLEQTQLPPKQISFQLGFSNVNNFRRAFKEWTGLNPSHYRKGAE
jgi:AraC-like DNA-binding protein